MGQPFDTDRQYPPQQQAPRTRRTSRGPVIAGLIAGVVIAAIVAGILALTGVLHVGSTKNEPARVSADAISLPSSLPGFQDYLTVNETLVKSSDETAAERAALLDRLRANANKVSSLTREAYQQANPGAAVAFGQYADSKLERQVNVIAVRATYPALTNGPVADPAYLGLAVAPQHIQSFGEVQCLVVQSQSTPAGQTPDPSDMVTTVCQRSGPALTVQLYAGSFSGAEAQQTLVNLTNSTWTSLTG